MHPSIGFKGIVRWGRPGDAGSFCNPLVRILLPRTVEARVVLRTKLIGLSHRVLIEPAALTSNQLVGAKLDEMHHQRVARQRALNIEGANIRVATGAMMNDVGIARLVHRPGIHRVARKDMQIRRFRRGVSAIRDIRLEIVSLRRRLWLSCGG